MMCTAPVNRVLRSSIVDGPGNRAVVFVQGCNYNCPYCHNPETIALCRHCGMCVAHCPTGALFTQSGQVMWRRELCVMCDACIRACPYDACPRIREMSPGEILEEIETAIPFIRGITVSGGECTLYPGFLQELFHLAHGKNLSCFLDTNGSFDFRKAPALLSCTDGVMQDIKAVSGYGHVTGTADEGALERAVFLAEQRKLWEIRTVIVPNAMDAFGTVDKICQTIGAVSEGMRYKLIKYRPMGVRERYTAALETPDDSLMNALADIVKSYSLIPIIL